MKHRAGPCPFFGWVLQSQLVSVLCVISDSPTCIKYRAVPWLFFFEFLSCKRVSVLRQNVDQHLMDSWLMCGYLGDPWGGGSAGTPCGRWKPTATQRRFVYVFGWICASCWGAPGSTLGVNWAPEFEIWSVYVDFLFCFLGASKTRMTK